LAIILIYTEVGAGNSIFVTNHTLFKAGVSLNVARKTVATERPEILLSSPTSEEMMM